MVNSKLKILLTFCLSIFIFHNNARCQIHDDLIFIKSNLIDNKDKIINKNKTNSDHLFLNEVGEVKFLMFNLIYFYQNFISSQDEPSCMFEPSCSQFNNQAIKKYGLIGILMGSDRVQRCNGFGHKYYKNTNNSLKIYDPVKKYHYGKEQKEI